MRLTISRAALMACAGLLAACGGDKDEAPESTATDTPAAETETAVVSDTPLEIPAAPENPLVEINAQKSAAFLADNAANPKVRELENGLQLETLTEGSGELPGENDFIRFHYKGFTMDGEMFDDSTTLDAPLVVPSYTAVPVPGMPEALAQMKAGEKTRVAVPPQMAFGAQGVPGLVGPNEVLVFELEVFEIVREDQEERRTEIKAEQERLMEEARAEAEAAEAEARAAYEEMANANLTASQAFLEEKRKVEGVQATESGLLYEIVEDGGEGERPSPEDIVRVSYKGTLPDGRVFDASENHGGPIEFQLSRVIPGWTEGVGMMNVGDKYRFYIPSELAYGPGGTPGGPIGPNQALVFDVELLGIEQAPQAPAEEPAAE